MQGESALDQVMSLRREVHDTGAAVAGIVAASDQALPVQTIDGNTNGSAGQHDFVSYRIHRQGTFVQQDLEYGEIGHAESERFDAFLRLPSE